MKVTAQEIEQRQMVLEVEVEDERLEKALDQAYKRIANRINVPGFRRGRAPRPLVERMVGREAIVEDAVEKLVTEVYRDVLKEQEIKAAGQPALEVTSTEPLHFKATVPLEPEISLGDYRSIDIAPEPVAVEESEIDEVVQNLRESNGTWVPVERAIQVGDRVALDVKATRGERTISDTKDAEFIVNPQGPEPALGFSEKLVGGTAGQELTFSLGGSPATEEAAAVEPTEFVVTVQWVKERELPEVDDEFARTVGEQESVSELRAAIKDQITAHKEHMNRDRHREAVLQAAVDQATVVLPPQVIERQASVTLGNLASRLDRQGITIEQYLQFTGKEEGEFRSELLAESERTLQQSLVLEAIGKAEGLDPSEAEVREEIELAAQASRDPRRTLREALASSETRTRIEQVLRSRKAIDRLVELAGGAAPEAATSAEVMETSGDSND